MQCILIGTTPEGRTELVGVTDDTRESARRALLLDLKPRGQHAKAKRTLQAI